MRWNSSFQGGMNLRPALRLLNCLRDLRVKRTCLLLVSLLLLLFTVVPVLRRALWKEFTCLHFYPDHLDRSQQERIAEMLAAVNRTRKQPSRRPDVVQANAKETVDGVQNVPGLMSTSLGDVRVMTYGTEDRYISRGILMEKDWEGPIRRRLEEFIVEARDPQLGFIDIGCNIGVFALTAAKHGVRVVAVDANRENLVLLAKSLLLNPGFAQRSTLVHNALSNEYRRVVLTMNFSNIGGSYVSKSGEKTSKSGSDVQAILADDLLPVISFKRAILKIDIEGFEHFAVAGAERLFDKLDVIAVFMEWGGQLKDVRKRDGVWAMEFMYHFFVSRGYLPYSAEGLWALPSVYCLWTHDIVWRRRSAYRSDKR